MTKAPSRYPAASSGPLTVELSPDLVATLEKLTYRNGQDLAENLRRAASTLLALEDAQARGETVVLRSANGASEQLLRLSGGPK